MKEMDLGLDRNIDDGIAETYDLAFFAELREFLNDKEFEMVYERLEKHENFILVMRKV
jgi:hypothetical protein